MYCQFKNTPKIIQEYLDCEDDPKALEIIEAKYGKKNLDKLITEHKMEVNACFFWHFCGRPTLTITTLDGNWKVEKGEYYGMP
jgi:hypothetical protein